MKIDEQCPFLPLYKTSFLQAKLRSHPQEEMLHFLQSRKWTHSNYSFFAKNFCSSAIGFVVPLALLGTCFRILLIPYKRGVINVDLKPIFFWYWKKIVVVREGGGRFFSCGFSSLPSFIVRENLLHAAERSWMRLQNWPGKCLADRNFME